MPNASRYHPVAPPQQQRSSEPVVGQYLLYTHWGIGNRPTDIDAWEQEKKNSERLDAPVCRYLIEVHDSLIELLNQTDGVLVLFFDPGWKLALKPWPTDAERKELERAEKYSVEVGALLAGIFSGSSRVHIVTVRELRDFIVGLLERDRPELYRWFVGETGEGAYDSPKVIEAFLRVDLIGSGLPVIRIDWDALVNVENEHAVALGVTQEAISKSLDRDSEERRDVWSRTWVCSVGYRRPQQPTYDEWSRGFATRIQPALQATPDMCRLVCGYSFGILKGSIPPGNLDVAAVTAITDHAFDLELTKQYLGVEQWADGTWHETAHEGSIAKLGAHPLHAVISGALFNLSASAILDLPPFSNMMRAVMWIDDHLKFELHRALGHLKPDACGTCRIDASVVKGRKTPEPNLAAYTWANYLPTLLLGLVMDAWIRKENEEHSERPFVQALKEAIRTGGFELRTAMKLERCLVAAAIVRIGQVQRAWSNLKGRDGTHTLASAWAAGEVEDLVKQQYPNATVNEKSCGLGLVPKGQRSVQALSDLSSPIRDEIQELIWDAIDYIRLTRHWPGMIQTIRTVEKPLVP
ncbi:MAG: hypothetical protein WAM82_27065 [Thermoanaerobaculia bacterium]